MEKRDSTTYFFSIRPPGCLTLCMTKALQGGYSRPIKNLLLHKPVNELKIRTDFPLTRCPNGQCPHHGFIFHFTSNKRCWKCFNKQDCYQTPNKYNNVIIIAINSERSLAAVEIKRKRNSTSQVRNWRIHIPIEYSHKQFSKNIFINYLNSYRNQKKACSNKTTVRRSF